MLSQLQVRHEVGVVNIRTLASDWERLVSVLGCPHPSGPFSVIAAILEHRRGAGGEAHAWIAYANGEPVSALLTVRELLPWSGTDQLRTPGDHDAYPVPLLARLSDSAAAAMLLRAACTTSPQISRCSLVRQTDRALFDAISEHAPDLLIKLAVRGKASYLPVPATEDELWSTLSSNFRKNLRKQRRKLDVTTEVSWRFLRGSECTTQEIERFLELEASGWKGQRGGAILRRPAAAEYYRAMLQALAVDGRLEMHQLLLKNRCVAIQVGVRLERTLCLLKISYDEGVAQLAPGNMLFLELVRREIATGSCREIDCLTDMPWHRNWAMHQRELFDVHAYKRTWRTLLFAYFPRATRDWVRTNPYLVRAKRLLRKRTMIGSVFPAQSAT